MSAFIKNTVFLGLITIVAVLGYYLFVIKDNSSLVGNSAVINQADAESREFLQRLQEIKSVDLDTEVLRDERFRALVDFSTDIKVVPVGRPNPFEPTN